MKVLITNDDGIRAKGLIALAGGLAHLGEVIVVAPDSQQSGVGHSITLHKPLRCSPEPDFPVEDVQAYSTNGTPTDAVLLGLHAVFEDKPDLVVSGINSGPNIGDDVTYSGTVAGAMEGTIAKIPSIAVSMGGFESVLYDDCAAFIAKLARAVTASGLPANVLLNVNYPDIPREQVKGIAVTRQGHRWYEDVVHERLDPRGREYYWITGRKVEDGYDPGTDAYELDQGFVSVSPLNMNLTDSRMMGELTRIIQGVSIST